MLPSALLSGASALAGISRTHAWVEFDPTKGVVMTRWGSECEGAPTFHNGSPLSMHAAPVMLKDGDTVGFGGDGPEVSPETAVFKVHAL